MGTVERATRLLERSGVLALAGRASRWRGVLILAYHRVADDPDADLPSDSVTPGALDAQLKLLRGRFELIAPSEVPAALHDRRGRFAAITFDDGYRDNYTTALPVLRTHGVRAGFFICTGFVESAALAWWDEIAALVGRSSSSTVPAGEWLPQAVPLVGSDRQAATTALTSRYKELPGESAPAFLEFLRESIGADPPGHTPGSRTWLSWSEIRELRACGMEIGGHTVNHPVLSRHPRPVQAAEIFGSAHSLAKNLGDPMRLFAYPVGLPDTFGPETRACLSEAGVELAFSCYGGVPSRRRWDPLDVRRVPIGAGTSAHRFRRMVELPRPFSRP